MTDVLSGGGEMGARMRDFDWSGTPYGAPEFWPQSLRSAVSICLNSRFPIAIYWGPQLALLYNDAWSPIPGEKHPWALGRPGRDVWPEIWAEIGPLFETVQRSGEGVWQQDQLLAMHRHGYTEECYFNFTFSPIRGEDGSVAGIFNAVVETTFRVIEERRAQILRDLSERTAVAKSAQEACARAAEVLGASPADVPFCLFYLREHDAPSLQLVAAAGAALPAQLAPRSIDPADPGAPWPAALSPAQTSVTDTLSGRFGVAIPSGIWPEAVEQAVAIPIADVQAAEPVGLLIAGVSPRRALDAAYHTFLERVVLHVATAVANARAYEAERRRAEALAAIDRAKTAFFSNISHEFRTPLTLMLGPLEDVLAGADRLPADDRERLDMAHRNALRLLRLVNTLLDFSRIEAGRIEASYEPVDLAALTAELVSVFRAAVERAGLRLAVDCPPLPEPVFVDREMWEKIVFNLLSNALKFTFEGEIAVALRQVGAQVELAVRDTGTGIPPDELPHLFERFHRVKGARGRTFEGSGIGLALVQELARLHGGAVRVESRVDGGSTFTVSLPLGAAHLPPERIAAARAHSSTRLPAGALLEETLRWLPDERLAPPAAAPDPETAPPAPADGADHGRARILLADDNTDMRDYVRRLLSQSYEVVAVSDGAAALRASREQVFDLVLTDVMMPELDGLGLLRALRADPRTRDIPIILLSARAGEAAKIEGLAAGADDYLVKPFSARELLARVEAHIKLQRLRRETNAVLRVSEQRLQRLNTASLAINAASTHEDVLRVITEEARSLIGAHQAVTSTTVGQNWAQAINEVSLSEKYAAWRGYNTRPDGSGIYTLVCQMNRPLRLTQAELEAHPAWRGFGAHAAQHPPLRGWLAAPLVGKDGQNIGLIQLSDKDAGEFSASDEALLVQLAQNASVALENQRLYEQEQRARAVAEEASRLKEEFLATVSHELRTPLTAFLGYAQMLQTRKRDEGYIARTVEKLVRSAKAQAQLIEDLLDISRIVSGKLRLEPQPIELTAVIRTALDTVRPALEAKGLVLQVELRSDASVIVGDPNRLQQVVWNLLTNAVKFTPSGGSVRVCLEPDGHEARITVSDTGKGIAAEFLPYVFDRFRQADATTHRAYGGLGLGLAIVRHLVELHGGTVQAASPGDGQGASFTIRLPLAAHDDALAPAEPQRGEADAAGACPPELAGLRVLLVDDQPDILELLHDVLTPCGALVQMCASAPEALETLRRWSPDVLVSDIAMPDRDGYWLIQQVRALSPEEGGATPAVALTAYVRIEDRIRVTAAGFQQYVPKPVEPVELRAVIARLTAVKQAD